MQDKLLWLDLEMTGLDPEIDVITEIAAIVTDFEFNELAQYQAVIKLSSENIERMKEQKWYEIEDGEKVLKGTVYDMHSANNMMERAEQSGISHAEAEAGIVKLTEEHFDQPAILAGNSIHQDRRFIRKYMQRFDQLLHYRMLDVTSYKIIAQTKFGLEFEGVNSHKAMDDIRDSINELQFYLKNLPANNSVN